MDDNTLEDDTTTKSEEANIDVSKQVRPECLQLRQAGHQETCRFGPGDTAHLAQLTTQGGGQVTQNFYQLTNNQHQIRNKYLCHLFLLRIAAGADCSVFT